MIIAAKAAFIIVVLGVAIEDVRSKSIYDLSLIVGALVSYPLLFFSGEASLLDILYGMIWGFASYGLIYFVSKMIYKEEVFGQGDVLFNTFICGFLGLWQGVITSFLTFFVALFLVIVVSIYKRSFDRRTEIPLAPSMAISGVITLFYYHEIIAYLF